MINPRNMPSPIVTPSILNRSEVLLEFVKRKGFSLKLKRLDGFKIQDDILSDNSSRFKALNATRRSGKSTTEVMSHVETCLAYPKSRTLYLGLTLDSVTDICWHIFKEVSDQNNLGLTYNEVKKIVRYPNGSRTRLFGLDASKRQLAKILGQKLRKVSIDEAGSITVDLKEFCFQKIRPSLVDLAPNSYLTLLGTCETIPNTYFEKVTKGECGLFDWKVYRWTAYDNPAISENWASEIKEITQKNPLALNTSSFKTHYLNEWCSDESMLIIPRARMIFEKELPAQKGWAWDYCLAVDLGYNDATAYAVIAHSSNSYCSYVVKTFKEEHQDFTDVANLIKNTKKDYAISSLVIDGANKQGVEEMKKRLGLPEIEIAEKTGKSTYLRLLADDIITGKIRFIEDDNNELVSEWSALQWKDSMREKEDPRCQNHLSDAVLYGWRKTTPVYYVKPEPPINPKSDEYAQALEDKEDEKYLEELEQRRIDYGEEEGFVGKMW